MKIRFSVSPPAAALRDEVFPAYLAAVDQLGFDTLWLSDIPLGTLGDPLISLTFAAARTERLKLGANVVPLGRNPLWLAKQLAQIDRLSRGRLLLSFVPGLGSPAERAALGYTSADRGRSIEAIMELLRRWWAGETVTTECEGVLFDGVQLAPLPHQRPLEIWLGGKGRLALERVARLGDGWLTSTVTAAEAAAGKAAIEARAAELGREIDAEHFGISIPVTRTELPESAVAALRARREDGDLGGVIAIGHDGLRSLVEAHLAGGISKFVLRPLNALDEDADWRADLEWVAQSVLDLQT